MNKLPDNIILPPPPPLRHEDNAPSANESIKCAEKATDTNHMQQAKDDFEMNANVNDDDVKEIVETKNFSIVQNVKKLLKKYRKRDQMRHNKQKNPSNNLQPPPPPNEHSSDLSTPLRSLSPDHDHFASDMTSAVDLSVHSKEIIDDISVNSKEIINEFIDDLSMCTDDSGSEYDLIASPLAEILQLTEPRPSTTKDKSDSDSDTENRKNQTENRMNIVEANGLKCKENEKDDKIMDDVLDVASDEKIPKIDDTVEKIHGKISEIDYVGIVETVEKAEILSEDVEIIEKIDEVEVVEKIEEVKIVENDEKTENTEQVEDVAKIEDIEIAKNIEKSTVEIVVIDDVDSSDDEKDEVLIESKNEEKMEQEEVNEKNQEAIAKDDSIDTLKNFCIKTFNTEEFRSYYRQNVINTANDEENSSDYSSSAESITTVYEQPQKLNNNDVNTNEDVIMIDENENKTELHIEQPVMKVHTVPSLRSLTLPIVRMYQFNLSSNLKPLKGVLEMESERKVAALDTTVDTCANKVPTLQELAREVANTIYSFNVKSLRELCRLSLEKFNQMYVVSRMEASNTSIISELDASGSVSEPFKGKLNCEFTQN